MNIRINNTKLILLVFITLVVIYWTKYLGTEFRSTTEFLTAKEFIVNNQEIKDLFGDITHIKFIKGETYTGESRKWAIYQFKIEDRPQQRVTVWVSPDKSCKGFLVRAEAVGNSEIRKTEDVCVTNIDYN